MKNGLVFDSFALLAYLGAEKESQQVKYFLNQAIAGKLTIYMSLINLGEVYYIAARSYGVERAEEALTMIGYLPIQMVTADRDLTLIAARIKARYPLAYADAFAAALAKRHGVPVLTGDPEFSRIEEIVSIVWLEGKGS